MKDAFIQIRIRKKLKEDFKKYCIEENLDMSEVITDYVKQLLREYKKERDQIIIPFE
jgi:antitoxin component of RelBE/YafQ-DinJ toxin-antitoxin module